MKKKLYSTTTDIHHVVAPSLTPLIVTAVIFWVPVTIFAKLAVEVREKEPIGLDSTILLWLNQFSNTALDKLALVITQAGGTWFIATITIISAAYILYLGHKKDALQLIIGVGGVALINVLLKVIFQRQRPSLWLPLMTEHTYSFPSGHAMASSAIGFSLAVIFWRTRYRWLVVTAAGTYIIAVGLSRLYLGVHYPTDVVAGWCVSLVWVLLVRKIINKFSHSKTYLDLKKSK